MSRTVIKPGPPLGHPDDLPPLPMALGSLRVDPYRQSSGYDLGSASDSSIDLLGPEMDEGIFFKKGFLERKLTSSTEKDRSIFLYPA